MSIIRYQFIQKIEWWNSLNIGTEYACFLCSRVDQSDYTMEIPYFYFYPPPAFMWFSHYLISFINPSTLCEK